MSGKQIPDLAINIKFMSVGLFEAGVCSYCPIHDFDCINVNS